jgi:hypothetical protein
MRARYGCMILLFLALVLPVHAAGQGGGQTFDRLLPEIRRHSPGSLYDVQGPYPGPDGRLCYRIKWMTPEGRIIWYVVDARDGHILGMVTGTMPARPVPGGMPPPYPPDGRNGPPPAPPPGGRPHPRSDRDERDRGED